MFIASRNEIFNISIPLIMWYIYYILFIRTPHELTFLSPYSCLFTVVPFRFIDTISLLPRFVHRRPESSSLFALRIQSCTVSVNLESFSFSVSVSFQLLGWAHMVPVASNLKTQLIKRLFFYLTI